MKFILVLLVMNINGVDVTTVPGYQSIEQCKAAGEQFKEVGFNKSYVCINAPQP